MATDLVFGVATSPDGIHERLAWPCLGVHHLDLDPCFRGRVWVFPVSLAFLLPGDQHEPLVALIVEDDADVVIISLCVHIDGTVVLHAREGVVSYHQARARVQHLPYFRALRENNRS